MRRLLTKARFERWLRGFKGGEVVGIRRKAEACPLARYLKDELGYRYVFVDGYTYEVRDPQTPEAAARGAWCADTPAWAERLIDGVDTSGDPDTEITALDVRRLLRQPAH